MVDTQIISRGITNKETIEAMKMVPRHIFVPDKFKKRAYDDTALPISEGQTISQPYIVALMIEALKPEKKDKALEVGTGSGYAAAILSRIVSQVYTIELKEKLAKNAIKKFKKLNYKNINVIIGDGSKGLPEEKPFDCILVSAAAPDIPEHLIKQLKPEGRLVIPIGEKNKIQKLLFIIKTIDESLVVKNLGYVRFVPLLDEKGLENKNV